MQFNLPKNLSTAIDILRESEAMPALMGNRFLQIYVAMKEDEYNEYFQVISPWERENLLLSV
jgi:glutamine synthetase